jgi:hypothetical protein
MDAGIIGIEGGTPAFIIGIGAGIGATVNGGKGSGIGAALLVPRPIGATSGGSTVLLMGMDGTGAGRGMVGGATY